MAVTITFLGASGTVTGSKYLVDDGRSKILVDGGMFQGEREWSERNWEHPAFAVNEVTATLLTHAHIDHTGMLPRFAKLGLSGPIYATDSSVSLSEILLRDAAHLQQEDAAYRARKPGRSRFAVPLPLYTVPDAELAISKFSAVRFDHPVTIAPGITARWRHAGHILGAASIELDIGGKLITFSGDIGRYGVPILRDPAPTRCGDLLLIESTYADREHNETDPTERLGQIISETAKRSGIVIIPSFAVGRAQQLLFSLRVLKERRLIPDIPVIVDSPMASDVTDLYLNATHEYDQESLDLIKSGRKPFSFSKLGYARTREDSMKLNQIDEPMIVIAASGMLTGGRVLHHLRNRVSSPKTTVIIVGHQPTGGRGWMLQQGVETIRLFGEELPVRARVETVSSLSAHGDRSDLRRWLSESIATSHKPAKIAVVHGEAAVAKGFATALTADTAPAQAPHYQERWTV